MIGNGNQYLQTVQAIKNIDTARQKLGSGSQDVVRTRMYISHIHDWQQIAKGHSEYFAKVRPATTMVQVSRFIDSDILIEIEAEVVAECEQQPCDQRNLERIKFRLVLV